MVEFDAPSYDGDVENRRRVAGRIAGASLPAGVANAFVIVSPEYNASMPGVLKNAIDWVARARHGRPTCDTACCCPRRRRAARPRVVRRPRSSEHLGARIYPDMFSLAQAPNAFADDGSLADERLQGRFDDLIAGSLDLVEASTPTAYVKRAWVEFLGERPNPAVDRVDTDPPQVSTRLEDPMNDMSRSDGRRSRSRTGRTPATPSTCTPRSSARSAWPTSRSPTTGGTPPCT